MILNFIDFINEEIDFEIKPTDYNIITINPLFVGKSDTIYRFLSKSGESYDLYFSLTKESDHLLSDGHKLYEYTTGYIPTIFFSPTKRGLNPKIFDKLTGRNEMLEVMGKVIFLIKEYIKVNKYDVYSIGEVDSKKYNFYSYYKYHFKEFLILEGNSDNYNGKKCHYLIKLI